MFLGPEAGEIVVPLPEIKSQNEFLSFGSAKAAM